MKLLDTRYTILRGRERVTLTRWEGKRGTPIPPAASLKIRDHSPCGFNYGYGGSGPAQLALAIMLDFLDDADFAQSVYQQFKWAFVCAWQDDRAQITGEEIARWIRSLPASPSTAEVAGGAR
jgi:hypothetical protein